MRELGFLRRRAPVGGIPGGVPGYIGGAIGGIPNVPPPPTPSAPKVAKSAEPASPVSPQRIRVGGQVQAALLIHEVQPLYPKLALQARISGTVRLKAVIGPDGSVQQLNFMSGPPLLVQAAMEAVQHWEYKPTYLNGRPVEVATEIDVHFTLTS